MLRINLVLLAVLVVCALSLLFAGNLLVPGGGERDALHLPLLA